MKKEIIVLGGGLLGVSCAILFKIKGFDVTIISEKFCWETSNDPTFASVYPAASIIPHNVEGGTRQFYETSHSIFKSISETNSDLVRIQKHIEVSELPMKKHDYYDYMQAETLEHITKEWNINIPKRDIVNKVEGFGFEILFVETPNYLNYLYQKIEALGIKLIQRKIRRNFLLNYNDTLFCNCLGINGGEIIDDKSNMNAVAGILVSCSQKKLLSHNAMGAPLSYNYHFKEGNNNLEVYSYPRNNDLLFGGTRIDVDKSIDINHQLSKYFLSKDIKCTKISGINVPNYIIDVNTDICRKIYGQQLQLDQFNAVVGLRPVREEGIRLEIQDLENSNTIINCYGFGGAGVTLSWGGAYDVLGKIFEKKEINFKIEELDILLKSFLND